MLPSKQEVIKLSKKQIIPVIINKLKCLNNFSKKLIKYGILSFICILASGLSVYIHAIITNSFKVWDPIGTLLVKNSFVILAEFIIGSLAIDYIIGKE